mgnify:CR=1 FL=1
MGYNSIKLQEIGSYFGKMNIIFYKISRFVLNKEKILFIKKDCGNNDLASSPGGGDFNWLFVF